MTEDQKQLCVRVLASVAWADGTISDTEIKHLEDEVRRLGYDNASVVHKLLTDRHEFADAEGVKKLGDDHKLELLKTVFYLADSCGGVSNHEEAVLEKISAVVLDNRPWPRVREWLSSYSRFMHLGRQLFA